MIQRPNTIIEIFITIIYLQTMGKAQSTMINVTARQCYSLNGNCNLISDPAGLGNWQQFWKERKSIKKTDSVDYAFNGGPQLNFPGDFNSQLPKLTHYEGIVWYKTTFNYSLEKGKGLFLHFGNVNYLADVFLNRHPLGSHEGGLTPFQFEITNHVKSEENTIIVRVNNQRIKDGLPGFGYDWINYGCITRDVSLIETLSNFIEDYFIQLKKYFTEGVEGCIKLDGTLLSKKSEVSIPDLNISSSKNSDGNIHLTIVNFNPNKSIPLNCEIRGQKISAASGSILTATTLNSFNSFENANMVITKTYNDAKVKDNKLSLIVPAKSVVVLEVKKYCKT